MDELFASPLKSMPNGVKYKTSSQTPTKAVKRKLESSIEDDGCGHSGDGKYYPIFEKSVNKRCASTPLPPKSSASKRHKPEPFLSERKPRKSKKKLPFMNSNDQYALDFGQKNYDAIRCKSCNMLYTIGETSDEMTHEEYHDMFVNSLRFNGWKNEDVVQYYDDGRVIRVLPTQHKKHPYMLKKIDDLFGVADLELGIRVSLKSCMKDTSVYLIFVTKDKRIAGFVSAERISVANWLVSEDPLMASTDECAAECGIARLWSHHKYRRHKVATRLLDTLRSVFTKDKVIPKSQLAFSDPTSNGMHFAKAYTGEKKLLIFQFSHLK